MVQIGNVPEINDVKRCLAELQERGFVREWELPYEELLTRLSAALFFLSPSANSSLEPIWTALQRYPGFTRRKNVERTMSGLEWRIEFTPRA